MEKLDIPFVGYEADWNKAGKRAAYLMNLEMLKNAKAMIYFWNGSEKDPKYIVNEAKKQNIPVRVIDFSKEKSLCPLCGGKLYRRQGKYGYFYGCCRYPECSGMRNSIE